MTQLRDISTKIAHVRQLKQVVRSMQLMATAKRRRCLDRMLAGRPYARTLMRLAHHMAAAHSEFQHPLLARREERRVGILLVTTDRGLCGGLNVRLLHRVVSGMQERSLRQVGTELAIFGKRGARFFQRRGGAVVATTDSLGDAPPLAALVGNTKAMIDRYVGADIDRLYLAYNRFENMLSQRPTLVQLLPAEPAREQPLQRRWDYIYEPESVALVDDILRRHIEVQVYQAVLENRASEMAARAVAMHQAAESAERLISDLSRVYHRRRQEAITQELEDIVGGSEALR